MMLSSSNFWEQDSFIMPNPLSSTCIPKEFSSENGSNESNTIANQNKNESSLMDKLNEKVPFFGLLMSLLSVICFSLCSLIVKILTQYHALEILGIRSIFQVIFFLITILRLRLPLFGISGHRIDVALRAIFGSIAAVTIYMSYRLIPLADASTIQFSAPVFVFVLAYFILGENLNVWHILIGLMALIGVVFVSKPKFIMQYFDISILDHINYEGIILAIVAAISTAFGMIMLRKLKQTPLAIVVFWFSVTTVISSFITLYFIGEFVLPKDLRSWLWLIAIGFAGIGDQLFMTLAFKYESAGIVSVSRTLTIVLAFIWDTLLFDVIVHWSSVLGSLLVITAVVMLAILKSMENDTDVLQKLWSRVCSCCCSMEEGTYEEQERLIITGIKVP